jgi:hypothetical protein
MGSVYEAEEATTRQRVAVKMIRPEYADSPEAVERFRREGRLASLLSHPRCVFVLAADQEAGWAYIVMERMPGPTLEDLVRERGPLPLEEAVALILDVIDGLAEAHRLGIIHRDVKPSNCFVGADGRIKVGDFGLAKSLLVGGGLTRTGSFLGTPWFASPEQVRGETVDPQTDVYSVAATLFFLLTGQAPFQSSDAAVTLARIVSDEPPSMRSLRPELSAWLDQVVLRGLERDRKRRWRDLDEFRHALLPFVPGRLLPASRGWRVAAGLIDLLPFVLLEIITDVVFEPIWGRERPGGMVRLLLLLSGVIPFLGYFILLEGWWGCSLGKRLLGLRVCTPAGIDPPGLVRATVRTGTWYVLALAADAINWFQVLTDREEVDPLTIVNWVFLLAAVVQAFSTMRARNGYRGPHEFASGTRTVRLPPREKRRLVNGPEVMRLLERPVGLPEQVGSFVVRGALRWTGGAGLLLAEDPGLGRRVILWLRSTTEPPLGATRCAINRLTRLRWLASGKHDDRQWDAFLAPAGCTLPDLIASRGKLAWPDARHLLDQLTGELSAACTEGTLPQTLTTDQVWVQPSGQVQLLDVPLTADSSVTPLAAPPASAPRPLSLLAQTAMVALEGRLRSAEDRRPLAAPVPPHAARILNRLLELKKPYEGVVPFDADLAATRDRPAEVSRPLRIAHLGTQTAFFAVGLMWMLLWFPLAFLFPIGDLDKHIQLTEQSQALLGEIATVEDRPLQEELRRNLEQARAEKQARLRSLSVGLRVVNQGREETQKEKYSLSADQVSGPSRIRSTARHYARKPGFSAEKQRMARDENLIQLAFWPALWVLWAFLSRGGLSLRMNGLCLLRANGRKAWRLQCAWRALLVWLPIVALLGTSVWLDARYWIGWEESNPDLYPWLASLSWWLGVGLLPLWVGLALWSPNRGLHDRLTGTYLVPI